MQAIHGLAVWEQRSDGKVKELIEYFAPRLVRVETFVEISGQGEVLDSLREVEDCASDDDEAWAGRGVGGIAEADF